MQGLSLSNRLAKAPFPRRDVQLAKPCNDLLVEPCGFAEFERIELRSIVEHRTGIGARKMDGTLDNGLQYNLQIERRTDSAPDLTQRGEIAVARLHLLEAAVCFRWR